jgi:hypothetical protein
LLLMRIDLVIFGANGAQLLLSILIIRYSLRDSEEPDLARL